MTTIPPARKITDIKHLKLISNQIRQDIVTSLVSAGSGHSAGPLGMADVFTVLYFNILNYNPKFPSWEGRDYLILSNGHICPVLYATMANAGYFPRKELLTLRHFGSRLQGHPHRTALPGLETTSGPLGSGLSQASGMALAMLMDNKKNRVYCVMSDGEQEAGNTWEAAMFAGKNKLRNLTAILDRNNIQIDGDTEDIMPLEPLADKYRAFNWHVIDVDAHNIQHFIDACNEAKTIYEKPTIIIAHNIPGKGVSFMENNYEWHGKPPTADQGKVALAELKVWREKIVRGVD
ncbi:TPA: transketolase [Candidatus Woesearchaeota archaeon]|nr:transketolase [Candidatus Woesearchaeota archaeon]